jgi:uncharacterized protein (DUF2062 family)
MPRKFLRRLSAPYRGNQRDAAWYLRPFHVLMAHPVYFSLNRRSITGGLAVGLFVGILPFIGHTPVAAIAALLLRVNLPVAVLFVWVGNPLTYGLIFYGEYLLGAFLLELPPIALDLDLPLSEIIGRLTAAWRPLWVGAIVTALLLSGTGYLLSNAAWRFMTRLRLKRRAASRAGSQP